MVKFVAIGLVSSAFGVFATPSHACGGCGAGGGSCSMAAPPVTTAAAKGNRSFSYEPSRGTSESGMIMRGGGQSGGSRAAGAKQAGNYGR